MAVAPLYDGRQTGQRDREARSGSATLHPATRMEAIAMDDATRAAVAEAQSAVPDAASLPAAIDRGRVVFGFDGYVDRVREMVADRTDPETYDRLATIAALGERVDRSVAADSSLSFEWLQRGTRTGGHTCHLARAFDTWAFAPSMVGMYGDPVADAFDDEFGHLDLHSLGDPGVTDAVEFDDGKLMLTEIGDTMALDWASLGDRFGHDRLFDLLDGAQLLGTGYWSETPGLPAILSGLRDGWAAMDDPPSTVLVDPGDVRKLDAEGLRAGREAIATLDEVTDVVVSANRAETEVLAAAYDGERDRSFSAAVTAAADALDPTWFVGHGVDQSLVETADGQHGVRVPAVDDPAMTTSSGDHFNAGLGLALLAGVPPAGAVVVGNAVAGYFVRTAAQPSLTEVRAYVDGYLHKFCAGREAAAVRLDVQLLDSHVLARGGEALDRRHGRAGPLDDACREGDPVPERRRVARAVLPGGDGAREQRVPGADGVHHVDVQRLGVEHLVAGREDGPVGAEGCEHRLEAAVAEGVGSRRAPGDGRDVCPSRRPELLAVRLAEGVLRREVREVLAAHVDDGVPVAGRRDGVDVGDGQPRREAPTDEYPVGVVTRDARDDVVDDGAAHGRAVVVQLVLRPVGDGGRVQPRRPLELGEVRLDAVGLQGF